MKYYIVLVLLAVVLAVIPAGCGQSGSTVVTANDGTIALPEPQTDSDTSLEEALAARRSVRSYAEGALTLQEIGQLCWAAQGITSSGGGRTAPSAGGLYPLTVYVVIGKAEGISAGVYKYIPKGHALSKTLDGDLRADLSKAALNQGDINQAPVDFVIVGDYGLITPKYGERGVRYTHLEAGHVAQDICLQCVGWKLGTVTIGAFDDTSVQKALGLPDNETPLYILPVGNL